jgi:hypothetical protein
MLSNKSATTSHKKPPMFDSQFAITNSRGRNEDHLEGLYHIKDVLEKEKPPEIRRGRSVYTLAVWRGQSAVGFPLAFSKEQVQLQNFKKRR